MSRIALPLLLIAALATTAAAQRHGDPRVQAHYDAALAGLKPGAPQQCIRRDRVTEVLPFGDVVLFREGRSKVWRNTLASRCAGLQRGDTMVTESMGGRYCAGDHVTTHAPVGRYLTGSCTLGDFVPFAR
ncbi:MAG: hypothetical protein WDN44_14345 [Sphingomonas sp.]